MQDSLPHATYDPDARLLAWPSEPPTPTGGLVVVAAAGTSDLPVAQEALLTARDLGRAVMVVAGMDGALASVVAGLVSAPVVACPTSVRYGASFGGVAVLLTVLHSCAPGVAVVNIDNGYGAGHLAAQIAAPHPDA